MENITGNQSADTAVKSLNNILRLTFSIVPIVAGLDKFTDLLAKWDNYLNPTLKSLLPFDAHIFMMIIGVVEIAAGIIVFVKPKIGGLIVSAWLILVALSLIVSGNFIDVAVRDIVMAIAAFTMARLAAIKS